MPSATAWHAQRACPVVSDLRRHVAFVGAGPALVTGVVLCRWWARGLRHARDDDLLDDDIEIRRALRP